MKIKYEFDRDSTIRILTECPYGETIDFYDDVVVIKVGSLACLACKYFKSRDDKKREVECRRKDER